ncbi:hypothetical protein [Corynebacterium phoceense]|uniref:hypothetical protein n=1 Tax=Corynebacterium phoceense TaxID=1686286 RepID=UPI00215C2564|nr:hypothetical protein [Corynebacterium phoceense]
MIDMANLSAFQRELEKLAAAHGVELTKAQVKHLATEAVGFSELQPADVRQNRRAQARFSRAVLRVRPSRALATAWTSWP